MKTPRGGRELGWYLNREREREREERGYNKRDSELFRKNRVITLQVSKLEAENETKKKGLTIC